MMGLTVKKIARLRERGRYLDANGLYLQVMSASNRSWLLRYELRGVRRWMGLGSLADFSLEEARQRARRARQLLADGVDPLEARRAERAQVAAAAARNKTFAVVAQEYYDAHAAGWSRKHRHEFLSTLRAYAFPTLGNLPVAQIDEPLVLAVLRPLWTTKTIGRRLRARIASVLDYANAARYRSGSNPARWEGNLQHLLAAPEKVSTVKHMAALPYAELPAFLVELRGMPSVAARALEFTVLTATRTNEVIGARWSEIDLEQRVWTIPAERMKAGKEHRVPLAPQAIALLRALPRDAGGFVFIGPKAGTAISNIAMFRALRRLSAEITVHGFRSSFRTWAEEQTAFAPVLAEQALAHTIGSEVERAYRRTDLFEKRKQLMAAWASFCYTPTNAVGEIVPLRRKP